MSFRTAAPAAIDYTASKRVGFGVTIANSSAAERRMTLLVTSPEYPGEFSSMVATFGGWRGDPTLEGPGRVTDASTIFNEPAPIHCGSRLAWHGGNLDTQSVSLAIPGRATTTLRLPFVLTGPPWPGNDHRVRVTASVEGGPSTRIGFNRPRVLGRTGVRIRDRIQPSRISPGKTIRISGTTEPPIRRQRLSLRHLRLARGARVRTLARVRTDSHGRFRARVQWPNRRAGRYELWLRYLPRSRRDPFSDYACSWIVSASPAR